jgi:hypothetical protein
MSIFAIYMNLSLKSNYLLSIYVYLGQVGMNPERQAEARAMATCQKIFCKYSFANQDDYQASDAQEVFDP